MALPREQTELNVRSLPRRRKSFDDDNNFHIIIAPGAVKLSRCCNSVNDFYAF